MFYILLLIFSLLLQYFSRRVKEKMIKNVFDLFSFLLMFFFSGLRYDVGRDYWGYFTSMTSTAYEVEIGARSIINFLNHFNMTMQWFIFIIAILTGIFFYLAVRYYDRNLKSRYLFIILVFSLIFFNSMNISRQFLSVAIFAFASKYIINRNFYKYLICIILAIMFHYTALLLLAIYPLLIIVKKIKHKTLFYNIIILVSIINIFIPILSSINQSLFLMIINEFPKYSVYINRIAESEYYYSEILFLYAFIVLMIINLNKKQIIYKDEHKNTLVPLSVIFIFTFSVFSFSELMMRLYYYFIFFIIALMATIVNFNVGVKINKMKFEKIIIYSFILILLSITIYSFFTNSELNLYPYKMFLIKNMGS